MRAERRDVLGLEAEIWHLARLYVARIICWLDHQLAGGAGGIHRVTKPVEYHGEDVHDIPHHFPVDQFSTELEIAKWAKIWPK